MVKVKGILFNIKADFILYEDEKTIINKEKDREREKDFLFIIVKRFGQKTMTERKNIVCQNFHILSRLN